MKKYDAIIIGAGPMGIFTAYELMRTSPEMKVLLIIIVITVLIKTHIYFLQSLKRLELIYTNLTITKYNNTHKKQKMLLM